MKNAFYFMLKAHFVLEIFVLFFFSYGEKRLDKKAKINFKIYGVNKRLHYIYFPISQAVKTTNQTIKFGQLIEYNMRNIFLEKSYTKCGGENSSRLFYKKSKLRISLDQQSEMLYRLFLLYVQVEVYQNILKLRC